MSGDKKKARRLPAARAAAAFVRSYNHKKKEGMNER
jgi:hypothetical protein